MNKTQDALRIALEAIIKDPHDAMCVKLNAERALAALTSQAEQAEQMTPNEFAARIRRGEKWQLAEDATLSAPAAERELPPLPEPRVMHVESYTSGTKRTEYFTPEDLHDYASAAVSQALAQSQVPVVDEREAIYRETELFDEWWEREQACPEHNLITRNAAHAAWHKRATLAQQAGRQEPVKVELPERVIDSLYQGVGLSTFHPQGSLQDKFYAFAHAVTDEVLARLPAAPSQSTQEKKVWTKTKDELPKPNSLIVKRWKNISVVWAGMYSGSAKDSSFDEWMYLPE